MKHEEIRIAINDAVANYVDIGNSSILSCDLHEAMIARIEVLIDVQMVMTDKRWWQFWK